MSNSENRYILHKKGLFFVVERYGRTLYTYAVLDTQEQAEETLDIVNATYG